MKKVIIKREFEEGVAGKDPFFPLPKKTNHETTLEALKIAYQYFNQIANTPDSDGYVVAPDSMTRVILRKMREAISNG